MGRSLLPSVSAHQAQHFAVSHPSRLPPCQLESWRHLPVASDEIPWRFAPALGESQGRSPARMEKGNAVPGFSAKAVDNLCTMWYIANIDHKKLVK